MIPALSTRRPGFETEERKALAAVLKVPNGRRPSLGKKFGSWGRRAPSHFPRHPGHWQGHDRPAGAERDRAWRVPWLAVYRGLLAPGLLAPVMRITLPWSHGISSARLFEVPTDRVQFTAAISSPLTWFYGVRLARIRGANRQVCDSAEL